MAALFHLSSSSFSRISLLLLLAYFAIAADVDNLYSSCNKSAGTVSSAFAANLRLLLPSLASNASLRSGFYNATAGAAGSDRAYGLALCRGDASPDVCRKCVTDAGDDILKQCNRRSAGIWRDYCQLLYSDTSFAGASNTSSYFYVWNLNNVTDPVPFRSALQKLFGELAAEAAIRQRPPHLFATGSVDYTTSDSVYGLVQCKPTVSGAECKSCLKEAVSLLPKCCETKKGGRVIGDVCNIRFEVSKFYEDSPDDRSPAPSPASSSSPAATPPPPSGEIAPSTNSTNGGAKEDSSRIIFTLFTSIAATATFMMI